jgi:nucleobase:cation symporter-1, NCS1 family
MIAAVGSVLITPWNLYHNPAVIHYTLETLGAFIGPLFGVLIAGHYVVARQRVDVDDLFTMSPTGKYWYRGGYNPKAIVSTVVASLVAMVPVLVPALSAAAPYSWFVGMALGFVLFSLLSRGNR